ncbi:MAG: hypothetical protein JRJ59_06050 [Deltaproteobacteria bacterium]|nr:hypothetical protein [Deltaproteobacteria bacterium]
MTKIIDLDNRRQGRREVLLEAATRMVRCSGCQLRCARCGFRLDKEVYPLPELGLNLCSSCGTEHQAYLKRRAGFQDPDLYWQNEDWVKSWTLWLDLQRALADYSRSKEFQRLLAELSRR